MIFNATQFAGHYRESQATVTASPDSNDVIYTGRAFSDVITEDPVFFPDSLHIQIQA